MGTLWSERIFTKLKYSEILIFTSTAGAITDNIYSQNDLFDPNVTGTGHQPMGFDQLAVLYNRYRVFGSKVTLRCSQTGTGTQQALTGTVSLQSTASVTPSTAIGVPPERDSTITRTVGAAGESNGILSAAAKVGTARGVTATAVRNDPAYSAIVTTDPATQTYWHIYYNTADGATTSTCTINVLIEYDCEFFSRVMPAGS